MSAEIQKFGLYVVVADLQSSRAFYQRLFGVPPVMQNDRIVAFDVAGGLYVLFSESAADRSVTKGDSAVGFIRVANIEHEFARVRALGATMVDADIVRDAPLELFRFSDPDGNMIEFYAVTARPA